MDEITAFANYLTRSVNRRLLKLLSWVLEMPDDYLWDNVESHAGPINEGYLRHALFHPFKHEEKGLGENLRMFGHTDFGTTTLLFSVPVTCLQIFSRDDKWRYVKYSPGALVVNIGDTLERGSLGKQIVVVADRQSFRGVTSVLPDTGSITLRPRRTRTSGSRSCLSTAVPATCAWSPRGVSAPF